MSLRSRVLAGLVAIALVLGIGAYVVAQTTRSNLQAQLDAQLESAGELVATFDFTGSGESGGSGQRGTAGSDEIRRLSTLYLGYVTTDDSVVTLYSPDFTEADSALPTIGAPAARSAAASATNFTVGSTASAVRYRVHAVRTGRGEVVLVALPLDTVDTAVSRLIMQELVVSGISIAVLALVGWWVVHLGIRPLRAMTSAAAAVAAGDLSLRVPQADPSTEAGELGAALNTMLARIDGAFGERARAQARLQQFVADASHELRTPVATIRGYAELHRHGALEDRAALADAMRRTEQETIRMGRLVDDMLLLAKLDARRPLVSGAVDLRELVVDAAADAHAMDPTRAIGTNVAGAPVLVAGDIDRLRQVIANLVTNALVHTPAGSPIDIGVRLEPDSVVAEPVVAELIVVDHGPGIDGDIGERVFQRFVRADASRARDRGGSGLGLAIVEAIVAAHLGDVRIEQTPGGGATFVVRLPICAPSIDAGVTHR